MLDAMPLQPFGGLQVTTAMHALTTCLTDIETTVAALTGHGLAATPHLLGTVADADRRAEYVAERARQVLRAVHHMQHDPSPPAGMRPLTALLSGWLAMHIQPEHYLSHGCPDALATPHSHVIVITHDVDNKF
jgi:hypothetical protein